MLKRKIKTKELRSDRKEVDICASLQVSRG